jgi:hypothetical protein
MSKPYIALDAVMIASMVFNKCESATCQPGSYCPICSIHNKAVGFALLQPFDYTVVYPPYLFAMLIPHYQGQRPTSTIHVLATYYAASLYIAHLFNPKSKIGDKDEAWHKAVLPQREAAAEYWLEGKETFEARRDVLEKSEGYTDLQIVQLFEDRLYQACAILQVVTGKYQGNWQEKHAEYILNYHTRRLVVVKEEMAGHDRLAYIQEETDEWNRQHILVTRQLLIDDLDLIRVYRRRVLQELLAKCQYNFVMHDLMTTKGSVVVQRMKWRAMYQKALKELTK